MNADEPREFAFHVDRHGVLAIPGTFWMGMAILCRYWLLIIAVGVLSRRGDAGLSALIGTGGVPWLGMAAEVPALVLAAAAVSRSPTAGGWARWVWSRGPAMVALTAALHLAVTLHLALHAGPLAFHPHALWIGLTLLDLAFVLTTARSPYHRIMFREFPAPPRNPTADRPRS